MCEGKWGEIPISHQQHGSTTGFNTWTVYLSDLLLSCPGVSCQMNTDDTVMYASA